MIAASEVTACILAGGRARRMGGAVKPLLAVDGVRILDRQRALLAPRAAELVISVAGPGPLTEQGVRTVVDAVAEAGPLAGIAAGLAASERPWLLVVAGDMPSIRGEVLDLLLAAATADVDAVVPWIGGFPEPLLALYGRGAAAVIARHLGAGQRSVQAVVRELRVAAIDEVAIRVADSDLVTFRNLNYPDQL